jgi:signal transduction histidine kinase
MGTLKPKIKNSPTLFGVLLGLILGVTILAVVIWLPWVTEVPSKHKALVQAIFFTFCYFLIWVYVLWEWHQRAMFWIAFCVLLLLHAFGILAFTVYVRPLFVREWMILGVVESFCIVGLVQWITSRFARHNRGL